MRARHFAILAIAALMLTLACDSGPKPGEEALYYGEKLKAQKPAERDAAIIELSKLKDKRSLPALHDALKGEHVEIKSKAAALVARIGDKTSVDPLISAIDFKLGAGRNAKERAQARTNEAVAKALGDVAGENNTAAIEALKQQSSSRHLETQLAAIQSLGSLKAKEAVQDLIDLADGHENNFIVKNAIIALGNIGDPKAADVLIKNLFFERKGVSFYPESSYALFKLGPAVTDKMVKTWKCEMPQLRELHLKPAACKAKSFVVLTDLDAKKVTVPLAMQEMNAEVIGAFSAKARLQAHEALGKFRVKKAAPGLKKFVAEVDPGKSEGAIQALVRIGDRSTIKNMLPMATHEGFVTKVPTCKDNKPSKAACNRSELQMRKMRLEAIAQLTTGAELKAWEKWAAEEKNEKVKKILDKRTGMLKAAKECRKKVDCWIGKLKDSDPRVREKAAWELAWSNSSKATGPLLDALADDDNYTRAAIIQALWWLEPKDGVDRIDEILKKEQGRTKFVRINEDLKRLRIKLARAG